MRTKSNRIETKSIESKRNQSKNRKNFLILKVLELREIFGPNRIETKSIEFNRIESKSIESNSEYALNSRASLYQDNWARPSTWPFILLYVAITFKS